MDSRILTGRSDTLPGRMTFFLSKGGDAEGAGEGGASESAKSGAKNNGGHEEQERTTAEWVTLVVSVMIVLGLAGLVLFQYVSQGTKEPEINVEPLTAEVRKVGDKYYLPIAVTNGGDVPVEAVEVEIEHAVDGEEPETVAFTVDFLAGHETDEYTVLLSADPSTGELSYTATYREP